MSHAVAFSKRHVDHLPGTLSGAFNRTPTLLVTALLSAESSMLKLRENEKAGYCVIKQYVAQGPSEQAKNHFSETHYTRPRSRSLPRGQPGSPLPRALKFCYDVHHIKRVFQDLFLTSSTDCRICPTLPAPPTSAY